MKVVLFGATGMVGKGVLLECLDDARVTRVLSVQRSASDLRHEKLEELLHGDFLDYSAIRSRLGGYDACFFCLGVSSVGMSEADYRRITLDFTLAAAKALIAENPALTFIYVSGTGTDESGKSSLMWARVKGETENQLLELPFKAAYMFRPGVIEPRRGVRPKAKLLRLLLPVFWPLFPILRVASPRTLTTTEAIGKAMIKLALEGGERRYFENADINALVGA
jgi:uncharacterized protein YbjT (DUF2867 family)